MSTDPYWGTPKGLRKTAAGHTYDNEGPRSPGWGIPSCQNSATVDEARARFQGALAKGTEEGMCRNRRVLLEDDTRDSERWGIVLRPPSLSTALLLRLGAATHGWLPTYVRVRLRLSL